MRPLAAVPLLLCAALAMLVGAGAVRADSGDAELARIDAERAAARSRFDAAALACRQRFAVTACVDDVRRREREALGWLRDRELAIDSARRQQRAADRRAAIAEKQRAQPGSARDPAAPAAMPLAPASPSATPDAKQRAGASPTAASPSPSPTAATGPDAERAAQAGRRVGAAERRRAEAEAARERVRQRLIERAAAGKPAAPLPRPEPAQPDGTASAPRR